MCGGGELEPGRTGGGVGGGGGRPRRRLPFAGRRTAAGVLARPPQRILPAQTGSYLTRGGEGCGGGYGRLLEPLGRDGEGEVEGEGGRPQLSQGGR